MAIIWTIVGIVIPFFWAVALSFVGYNPPEFRNARALVWASFGILTVWTIVWLFMTAASRGTQVYTAAGVGFLNLTGITLSLLFIGTRERLYMKTEGAHKDEQREPTSSLSPQMSTKHVDVPQRVLAKLEPAPPLAEKAHNKTTSPGPYSSGADQLTITTDINLKLQIKRIESADNQGLVFIVDNDSLEPISGVSLTIYGAQSFDANHQDFRTGFGFTATRVIDIGIIPPATSSRPLWIVRKDRAYTHLLAGDDNSHQMVWPDNDKSEDQRWQLSLGISAAIHPARPTERPQVFPTMKMKLVAVWLKESNRIEIGGASSLTT